MDRDRVEEFIQGGKTFVYIDFSGLSQDEDFCKVIAVAEPAIAKYPERSVYTITNIANIRFDSHTKEIAAKYMEHNKPYVKYGVVIGFDGIKKMMAMSVMQMSGRENLNFTFTKEQAIELLLQQD